MRSLVLSPSLSLQLGSRIESDVSLVMSSPQLCSHGWSMGCSKEGLGHLA